MLRRNIHAPVLFVPSARLPSWIEAASPGNFLRLGCFLAVRFGVASARKAVSAVPFFIAAVNSSHIRLLQKVAGAPL
jgi:hypothetical protein